LILMRAKSAGFVAGSANRESQQEQPGPYDWAAASP
jgi:hypothetical protein